MALHVGGRWLYHTHVRFLFPGRALGTDWTDLSGT